MAQEPAINQAVSTYPELPNADDVHCDHCNVILTTDEAWHRPAYTEIWLCTDCAKKGLKKYDMEK